MRSSGKFNGYLNAYFLNSVSHHQMPRIILLVNESNHLCFSHQPFETIHLLLVLGPGIMRILWQNLLNDHELRVYKVMKFGLYAG
jgi:hypothetical protein